MPVWKDALHVINRGANEVHCKRRASRPTKSR